MKHITFRNSIVLAALLAILAVGSYAQQAPRLTADIPFDFYVNGKNVLAGEYIVQKLNPNTNQAVLVISRRSDGKHVTVLNGVLATPRGAMPAMLFEKIGDTYHLAEIRNPGANFAATFPSRSNARNGSKLAAARKEKVTIALRSPK